MKSKSFSFEYVPRNLEGLKLLPQANRKDPFGICALTLLSMYEYQSDKEESLRMLKWLKGKKRLSKADLEDFTDLLEGKDEMVRGCFEGSTVLNQYQLTAPLEVCVYDSPESDLGEDTFEFMVYNSENENTLIIVTQCKDGLWYLI